MSVIKAGVAAGLVILAGALVAARQAQPPAQPDVLPALLEEVKGLRAAMEQMASAGPRIQLFTSRLQLQEARINNMIHRLDTVRDSLASGQKELASVQTRQRQTEAVLSERRGIGTPDAQEEVRQAGFVLDQLKQDLATARANVDRYTAEEAQLTGDIATEQARWTDINARLDDLERALSKR